MAQLLAALAGSQFTGAAGSALAPSAQNALGGQALQGALGGGGGKGNQLSAPQLSPPPPPMFLRPGDRPGYER